MTHVLDPALAAHVSTYPYAIVSYVDRDGYPVNVATPFRANANDGLVHLEAFDVPDQPQAGTQIELTFSHVRPRPGIGYDERRYVNLWGPVSRSNGGWAVAPTRRAGWDEQTLPFMEYCERTLPAAQRYMDRLSDEQGRKVAVRLSPFWRFFLATRIPFLTATIVPMVLGAVIARADGFSAWGPWGLAFFGAACIHLGLNTLNDIFDERSGADAANMTPTPFSGGSRVVIYGLVAKRSMWMLALVLFGLGSAIGGYLALTRATEILWLGIAGVVLSIGYTAPPLKLVYRGLGDIAVAAGFGPIMTLGSYAVVAQRLSFEALFASLPVGILVMLILYVNQVPDRRGDAAAGKRTVAVRFSRTAIVRAYDVFVVLAFAVVVAGVAADLLPVFTLLALVAAPLALRVRRGLARHYDAPYLLMPALAANIALHLLAGLGLIAGYVLHIAV
jgi:1,4-dihydroxy-2-naphthoate octaprenyltransferase